MLIGVSACVAFLFFKRSEPGKGKGEGALDCSLIAILRTK